MVTSLYNGDTRLVIADRGSEFFDFLSSIGIPGCEESVLDGSCRGTIEQFIEVFFGFDFTVEHSRRNALILGGIVILARVMTYVALKYIRFS